MDWQDTLRAKVAETSQSEVSRNLGVSVTMINRWLKGKYQGNEDTLAERVASVYHHATVDCPVLGETPRHRCLDFQAAKFAATNSLRTQLARQCKACPHNAKR
jgi:transcriptional regulator with XRE-family HTH domain